jgi:hypothetical protein
MADSKANKRSHPMGLVLWPGIGIAFTTSIILLLLDRTASGTVAATLTLALLLFRLTPIIESFEVFGLKAKFRQGVEELNRVLANVTKTAEVSSKLLYIQLSWMNRMGSITWGKKRELLSDIDELLVSVGISEREIEDLKQPFIVMISYDLLSIFMQVVRFRVNHYGQLLQKEYDEAFKGKPVDQSDARYLDISERRKKWAYEKFEPDDIMTDTRILDLEKLTQELLSPYPFPDEDLVILDRYRTIIVKLATDCWAKGTITPDAEQFLETYRSPQDKPYREAFDVT